MQGTQVQSLVWEDYTHLGATKPVSHNYPTRVLQLRKPVHPGAHASQQEKPLLWEACAPQQTVGPRLWQLEKGRTRQ